MSNRLYWQHCNFGEYFCLSGELYETTPINMMLIEKSDDTMQKHIYEFLNGNKEYNLRQNINMDFQWKNPI